MRTSQTEAHRIREGRHRPPCIFKQTGVEKRKHPYPAHIFLLKYSFKIMHISSLTVVTTLFVGIVFASHTSQSSVSRLTRRDHDNNHNPFANMYIMKDKLEYSQDGLLVYYPNGSIAYIFDKSVRDIRQGMSSVVLRNQYHQPLLTLNSQDDICFSKTHYVETNGSESHHMFEIDPRGPKADVYNFRYITPEGEEINYRYERNYLDRGGKIYESRKGKEDAYVGLLERQYRWEAWLKPGAQGARTFTLSCTATSPQVEMATLMGLVLTRTDACKL
ncbi:hypothetical protein PGTUg99_012849 [Puccinia graminis f. sp. tritici]|uniref:Uncharacterized protein n=1 Tax=Puccinia graminis f. sp. tritici TaxID=56615 RepID=A0A5B0RET5_PUCGR|nr:hypothetical protein PGTUg99_012849 [Puccinia graminis f. sp. tritici]